MPIFRGKAKLNTGAPKEEESVPSKQNYDFSSMKMSAATAKGPKAEGAAEGTKPKEQKERRQRASQGDDGFGSDDGFEVVTEKKRLPAKRGGDFSDASFGKPSFTRGGRD